MVSHAACSCCRCGSDTVHWTSGAKACLHVHGVYPYFCFPFEAEKHIDKNSFFRKLTHEIDHKTASGAGSSSSRVHAQVHSIEEIKGTNFYGYHANEELFLKLNFYNPFVVQKASDLLSQGKLLNLTVQPFQSHIPYILQVSSTSRACVCMTSPND